MKKLWMVMGMMGILSLFTGCGFLFGGNVIEDSAVGVIGGEDGPTAIITTEVPVVEEEDNLPQPVYRLGGLKGPTSMGMAKLLDDAQNDKTAIAYEFEMGVTADEVTPKFIKGELDIISVPANLAAILYEKTQGEAQVIAVNTLGVLYMVEQGGTTVQSISDLQGKTIYATGKGTTPEYVLSYLLAEHDLVLGTDVIVEWKSEPTEVIAALSANGGIAMMPQPFVTVAQSKLPELRVTLDLTKIWDDLDKDGEMVTSVLLARKDFVESADVQAFLADYQASTNFINDNVPQGAILVEELGIIDAKIGETAIPHCNLVSITGDDMKEILQGYLGVLYKQNPKAVGGAMPLDDFYYDGDGLLGDAYEEQHDTDTQD